MLKLTDLWKLLSSSSRRSGPSSRTRFSFWVLFVLAACRQRCSLVANSRRKEVKDKVNSKREEDQTCR